MLKHVSMLGFGTNRGRTATHKGTLKTLHDFVSIKISRGFLVGAFCADAPAIFGTAPFRKIRGSLVFQRISIGIFFQQESSAGDPKVLKPSLRLLVGSILLFLPLLQLSGIHVDKLPLVGVLDRTGKAMQAVVCRTTAI